MNSKAKVQEIFKNIQNYEGLYQVSNLGRVKSLKRKGCLNDRILKQSKSYNGYNFVSFNKKNKSKNKFTHQLVAEVFLNHKPNRVYAVVDHINNIKNDNRLVNLQIISSRENTVKDKSGYSSKYIGVCWDKGAKKWESNIYIEGKKHYLGRFFNELEASNAYQNKLNEHNSKRLIEQIKKV